MGDRFTVAGREFGSRLIMGTGGAPNLDVLEEAAWIRQEPAALLDRAHTVAVYKSAKYSVEAPLTLGALLAARARPAEVTGAWGPPGWSRW